ncbi:hypothetical protein [Pseudomonas oryziphila]|uniref:Oligosaccharide repeat unit polymerase n=1 Tax=Pseudomonas entomophila TaxID=312306 RepID=A0A3S8UH55_9PSED|nr:hypothetical protein [Pseudomonas oryziphila]AZL67606.1 hypothetical protein EJA05_07530 [Pseudomonas oryziphila]
MRYYIPIVLVEVYLCATLLVFQFGPVSYRVHDPAALWGFIFLYHVSMVVGYVLACRKKPAVEKVSWHSQNYSPAVVWGLMLLAVVASILGHRNITGSMSLFSVSFLQELIYGVNAPGIQYAQKVARVMSEGYAGDKFSNVLYFLVSPAKVIIIPVLIFFWDRMSVMMRVLGLFVSVLPVLSGVSVGTNKPVFDFAIFFASSLAVYFALNRIREGVFAFHKRKFFLVLSIFSFLGAVFYFGWSLHGRSADMTYITSGSVLGDISIRANPGLNEGWSGFLMFTFMWLSSYLAQGYYGFSLALEQSFTSTYGFGNSPFLMRQFEWVTGVDISANTYQHKISAAWGETSQWHSLYSHVANDVGFYGVAVFCLVFGFYLAKIWISIVDTDNLWAKLLVPLFALAVIFMPANNQVLGYLDSFSTFSILTLIWLCSVRKKRRMA